jgi:hypothetical protein
LTLALLSALLLYLLLALLLRESNLLLPLLLL